MAAITRKMRVIFVHIQDTEGQTPIYKHSGKNFRDTCELSMNENRGSSGDWFVCCQSFVGIEYELNMKGQFDLTT